MGQCVPGPSDTAKPGVWDNPGFGLCPEMGWVDSVLDHPLGILFADGELSTLANIGRGCCGLEGPLTRGYLISGFDCIPAAEGCCRDLDRYRTGLSLAQMDPLESAQGVDLAVRP